MSSILSSTLRVMLALCLVVGLAPTAAYASQTSQESQEEVQTGEAKESRNAIQSSDLSDQAESGGQPSDSGAITAQSEEVSESDLTPTIKTQPESARYIEGDAAADLKVLAQRPAQGVGTSGTLTYQWYAASDESLKGAQAIKGETYTSLPVGTEQTGYFYYYCEVTNTYNGVSSTVKSNVAKIQVTSAHPAAEPQIVAQPESASVEYGSDFEELAVVAKVDGDGAGELTYQWYTSASEDGADAQAVEGADKSYWTPGFTEAGIVYAFCRITNHFNGATEEASVDTDVVRLEVSNTVSIRTADDLVKMRKNVVEKELYYSGITVKLENDIDMSSVCSPIGDDGQGKGSWLSIGNYGSNTKAFSGTFDGNYHKINNYYLENNGTDDTAGFFYATGNGAVIRNLEIDGYACGGGSYYLGAIVARSFGTTFENIVCNVEMDCASTNVGGICGYASSGVNSFINCAITAEITNSLSTCFVGGVAGYCGSSSGSRAQNCYNLSNINLPNSNNATRAGGLIGYASSVNLENCYSASRLRTLSDYAGILVGYSYSSTYNNCYCIEPVMPDGDSSGVWASNSYGALVSSEEAKNPSFAQTLGHAYYSRSGDYPALVMQKRFEGAPIITKHPESAEYQIGANPAALTVKAYSIASGTTLSYQWFKYKDGENPEAIAGATQASYTPQRINGETNYFCQITASAKGSYSEIVNSDSAKIVCYSGIPAVTPVIEENPQSFDGVQGDDYTLSVKASISGESVGYLTYQWYEATEADLSDAKVIDGEEAKQAQYNPYPASLQPGISKYYYCVVTNNYEPGNTSSATSLPAKLSIDSRVYISTAEELIALRDNVNVGMSYEGCTIYITEDIDVTTVEEDWTPIGNSSANYFWGAINGNYHSIKFNSTKGGLINYWRDTKGASNLYLDGSMYFNSYESSIRYGALAAYIAFDDTVISNVVSRVSITGGSAGRVMVSGLIGLVTKRSETATIRIERCAFKGSINMNLNTSKAAGLLLTTGTTTDNVTVIDCYNTADIMAAGYANNAYFAAGIVGDGTSSKLTLINCYNAGSISNTGSSKSYTNAIAFNMAGTAENCYALSGSASNSVSGCDILSESEMKNQLAEKLGDSFEEVNGDYPRLTWEGHKPITISTTMRDAYYDIGEEASPWEAFVSVIPREDETVTYKWYESENDAVDEDDALVGTGRQFTPATTASKTSYYYCIGTYEYTGVDGVPETQIALSDFCRVEVGLGASEISSRVLINGEESDSIDEEIYEDVELSVEASFTDESAYCGEMSYQWFSGSNVQGENFKIVTGATDTSIVADTSNPGDIYYYCEITNGLSSYTTATAPVRISISVPEIASLEDLEKMRDNVNAGNSYEGVHLKQTQDIDMSGKYGEGKLSWDPIGSGNVYFKGSYDGMGHTIEGFYMSIDSSYDYYNGLFGKMQDAAIKNLSISGSIVNAGTVTGKYAAGFVGYAYRNCEFENLVNRVSISGIFSYAAGIASYCSTGYPTFTNCANLADIDVSGSCVFVAGIAYAGNTDSRFFNCYNAGDLTNPYSSSSSGGVAGISKGVQEMRGCFNSGTLTAPNFRHALAADFPKDGSGISVGNYAIEGDYSTVKSSSSYLDFGPVEYISSPEFMSVDVVAAMNASTNGSAFVMDVPYPRLRCEVGDCAPVIESQSAVMESYVQGDRPATASLKASLPEGIEGELGYQWYIAQADDLSDARAIEGETSPDYVAQTASMPVGTNRVFCEVTCTPSSGEAASVRACYSVYTVTSTIDAEAPVIAMQPKGATYDIDSVSKAEPLSVGVSDIESPGIGEYSYQWYSSASSNVLSALPIEGANEATYAPNISNPGIVYYFCVVTNTLEEVKTASAYSDVAEVVVYNAKSVAPVVKTNCAGDILYTIGVQNDDAVIEIDASLPLGKPGCEGVMSVEWYRSNNVSGAGATLIASEDINDAHSLLTFDISEDADSQQPGTAYYYAIVSNTFYVGSNAITSSVKSSVLHVNLLSAIEAAYPVLTISDPSAKRYTQGDTADNLKVTLESFAMDPTGSVATTEGIGTVKGQWFRSADDAVDTEDDDVAMGSAFILSLDGTAQNTLAIPTTGYDGNWYYYCKVINTFENVKTAVGSTDTVQVTIDPKYCIYSAQELRDFINSIGTTVNGARFTCKDLTVSLQNDIDLGSEEWVEYYNSNSYAFAGIFEGNGHTISGLAMTKESGSTSYYGKKGLFGSISGATVRNLTVKGSIQIPTAAVCQTNDMWIGGIAGSASSSIIENCKSYVDIRIDATTGYGPSRKKTAHFGGVVGYCVSSTVKNCAYEGIIDAYIRQASSANSITAAGGIAGALCTNSSISSSYAKGSVLANRAGGIAGVMYNAVSISDCYFDGVAGNARATDTSFNSAPGAIASGLGVVVAASEYSHSCTYTNNYYNSDKMASDCGTNSNPASNSGVSGSQMTGITFVSMLNANSNSYIYSQEGTPVLLWELNEAPLAAPVITKNLGEGIIASSDDELDPLSIDAELPADAKGSLSYQWYSGNSAYDQNAEAILGANGNRYYPDMAKEGIQPDEKRFYWCVVTNTYEGVTTTNRSSATYIWRLSNTPASTPVFTSQNIFDKEYEYAQTMSTADYQSVTVDANLEYSDGAIRYQWYTTTSKDEVPQSVEELQDGKWSQRAISGATTYRYVNTGAANTLDDKYYFCVVTNTYQRGKTSMAVSDVAHISVNPEVKVYTFDDLKKLSTSGASYEGITVSIENDIVATGNWSSRIGKKVAFKGVIEGNGHTISGITIASYSYPVFYSVEDALIKDIRFQGSYSATDPAYYGVLVYQSRGSEFVNVGCDFSITSNKYAINYSTYYISSFVNKVLPSLSGKRANNFINCYAKSNMTISNNYSTGYHNIGAFVGSVTDGSNALFENCYFNGSISMSVKATSPLNIGAFAGEISSDTIIKSCYTSIKGIDITGHDPSTMTIAPIASKADGAQVIGSYSEVSVKDGAMYKATFENGMPLFNDGQGMTRAELLNQQGNGAYVTIGDDINARLVWEGEISAKHTIADIPVQSYTGEALEPSITVEMDGQVVDPSTYRLLFMDNVDPGAARVYAIFQDGTYCIKSFDIVGLDLSTAVIDPIPVQAYTSVAVEPSITVRIGGNVLEQGADYRVDFTDNTNVGTAKVAVSGLGAYKGQSLETTFEIEGELASEVYISTAEELAKFAIDVNRGLITQGRKFFLANDIDLSSVCYPAAEGQEAVNWTPIGTTSANSFKGTFDGLGHSIMGIYAYSNDASALFGYVEGATIKDISLDGVIASSSQAAGFVVEAKNSKFENLVNNANISSLNRTNDYFAGIISQGSTSSSSTAGSLTIRNCANKGDIDGTNAIPEGETCVSYVAGIIGSPGYETVSMDSCYNLGDISGSRVGGLIGFILNAQEKTIGNVSNCYNAGHIEIVDPLTTWGWGPLIAYGKVTEDGTVPSGMGTITNNYYLENNFSSNTDAPQAFTCMGQYAQTEAQMKAGEDVANSMVNALNIGDTRYVGSQDAYPTLRFETAVRAVEGDGAISIAGIEDMAWTGDAIELPNLCVSDINGALAEGEDYTVKYANNIGVGTATVTITFINGYYDSISKDFGIVNPDIPLTSDSVNFDSIDIQYYRGAPISPTIKGTYTTPSGNVLTLGEGSEYTVSFRDNDAPGTATAVVTGRGRFSGALEIPFEIARMSLGDGSAASDPVSVEIPGSWFYTGSPIEPAPVVRYGDELLSEGADFTCTYSDNVEIGTSATVTVTAAGHYEGSCTATFEIQRPVFGGEGSSVSIAPIGPQPYTGSQIRPEVTLIANGGEIDASAFDVSYGANTDVATGGTVTVSTRAGSPYGEGSITAAFEIEPLDISADAEVAEATAESAYTGSPVYASSVRVVLGGRELEYGTDFVVDPEGYADNVDAGEARLAVLGAGNYTGSVIGAYAIGPADASGAVVSCNAGTYTGAPVEPEAAVRFNGEDVTASFDIAYEGNVDAGEATVRATALANTNFVEGTQTSSIFVIEKGAGASVHGVVSTPESIEGYTRDGSILGVDEDMEWRAAGGEWAAVEGDSVTGLTCGPYEVRHAETANTLEGAAKAVSVAASSPQVKTLAASAAAVDLGSIAYGASKSQAVTVTNTGNVRQTAFAATSSNAAIAASVNATTLEPGASLTLNVSATKASVGTYTSNVTVRSAEGATTTVSVRLVVTAKDASALTIEGVANRTYSGSAQTQSPTVKDGATALREGTDYTLSYANNVNAGTATMTVAGKGNYAGSKAANFAISPMSASAAVKVASASMTYTGKALTPAVTVTAAGKTLGSADYTVSYSSNTSPGRATVSVALRGNYAGSGSATFDIVPKKVSIKAPTAAKKALTVKWSKGAGVTGYEIMVATNKKFTAGKKTVKVTKAATVSKKVTGLKSKKTYYVKIRSYKTVGSTKLYSAWSTVKSKKTK